MSTVMKKVFAFMLFVSLLLSILTPAYAVKKKSSKKAPSVVSQERTMSPADIFRKKSDSIVTIYTQNEDGTLSSGSGFFVEKSDLLLTNFHVISKAESKNILVVLKNKGVVPIVGIVAQNPGIDLVLLRLANSNATPLTIAKTLPSVGEKIVVIGAPSGYSHTLTDGTLSAVDRGQNGEYIQISAPVSPGSSGSPVFNDKGEVIGIVTFSDARPLNQNLNFAPSVASIKKFLNEKPFISLNDYKVQQRQTSNKTYYKATAGEIIYTSGDYTYKKSIKLLRPIKSTMPGGLAGIHFWFEITAPCELEYVYTYKGLDLYAAPQNLVKAYNMGMPCIADGDLVGIFINPRINGYGWFVLSSIIIPRGTVWTRGFKQSEFGYVEDTKSIYFDKKGTVCIVSFKGLDDSKLIFHTLKLIHGNTTKDTGETAININKIPGEFMVGGGVIDVDSFENGILSYDWIEHP